VPTGDPQRLYQRLGLPEGYEVAVAVAVGHPGTPGTPHIPDTGAVSYC
jgi:hypothetical protein